VLTAQLAGWTRNGWSVNYAGMDATSVLDGDAADRVIKGSIFDDTITLADDPLIPGNMKVTINDTWFFNGFLFVSGGFSFANPTSSLTIEAGSGGDTITILSVDEDFAADLLIYGNKSGAPTIEPDAGHDVVIFAGNTFTRGGYLEVFADDIKVNNGVIVSTVPDDEATTGVLANGNDIVFRARRIGTPEIENLLPAGYLSKSVSIEVGTGAVMRATSIYLIAQAEDRALATTLGLTTLQSQMFLNPAVSFLTDLVTLPIKVLVKASEARVTIGVNSRIQVDDVISIYATAGSDASGQAKSQLISLGYSQADATAEIHILAGALIEGNGPINITSAASRAKFPARSPLSSRPRSPFRGPGSHRSPRLPPPPRFTADARSMSVRWAKLNPRPRPSRDCSPMAQPRSRSPWSSPPQTCSRRSPAK
jgi:hypothetical protein